MFLASHSATSQVKAQSLFPCTHYNRRQVHKSIHSFSAARKYLWQGQATQCDITLDHSKQWSIRLQPLNSGKTLPGSLPWMSSPEGWTAAYKPLIFSLLLSSPKQIASLSFKLSQKRHTLYAKDGCKSHPLPPESNHPDRSGQRVSFVLLQNPSSRATPRTDPQVGLLHTHCLQNAVQYSLKWNCCFLPQPSKGFRMSAIYFFLSDYPGWYFHSCMDCLNAWEKWDYNGLW